MSTSRSPHQPSAPDRACSRRSHGWLMIICCIPMLVVAVVLVATDVVGAEYLLIAIACTAMMFVMMRGMGHGGH